MAVAEPKSHNVRADKPGTSYDDVAFHLYFENFGDTGDTGTGQCPDCFKIVFEIFEMIFLPIPVSRWS